MNTQNKGRRIAAWILTGLLALMFVGSSLPKKFFELTITSKKKGEAP